MSTIYTLGYSGWKPEAIKRVAERLGAIVLDVRASARSRRAAWTAKGFAELLGDRYVRFREFGNRNYLDWDAPIELNDSAAGLARIRKLLGMFENAWKRPVILLCACRDVTVCHRKVVAELLAAELGWPVEHLAPEVPPKQSRLF